MPYGVCAFSFAKNGDFRRRFTGQAFLGAEGRRSEFFSKKFRLGGK